MTVIDTAAVAPQVQRDTSSLRPTMRAVWVFALGIPLACLILAWNRALWSFSFVYALLALVAVGIDALLILRRRDVKVAVKAPIRLPVGEMGQVRVDVSVPPTQRLGTIKMVLEQTGPADPPIIARAPIQTERLAIALPLQSARRGRVDLAALWLRWAGPLGLVERRWRMVLDRVVDVVPVVRGLRGAALNVVIEDAQFGIKSQLKRGEGSEFETLREHVAGLDNRHIDWKRSARHTKLLSKVFRTERNHQVIVAFDTGHLMLEPIDGKTRLDHAIEAALMLGWVSLKSGDLVGSFGFDANVRQYVVPGSGIAYLSRVQQAVARLAYSNEETNFTLGLAELNQRLKRRALVVLFTEFVDTVTAELLIDAVQRIALRHVVVFVTMRDPALAHLVAARPEGFMPVARAVIAHDLLRERAIVLERLARLGVHVLDVEAGGLSTALLNRYLLIKQRGEL